MAIPKQVELIISLYEEIGQEQEDDIEELNTKETSKRIKELLAIKRSK